MHPTNLEYDTKCEGFDYSTGVGLLTSTPSLIKTKKIIGPSLALITYSSFSG